ncbi:HNH endonuclease, partial [Blastococcus sp. CCUG 61487]|uniref:HNH endonuclease n=1 Tax=Blastococcus sp. CCUG 61487 TaxID=1840703 RepID=UPI0010BFC776
MTTTGAESPPLGDGLVGLLLSRGPSIERLPVEVLSPEQAAAELERVQARKAMDAAYEAELVMVLAAARPDTDDPPPGHPGARRRGSGSPVPGTSEFFPDELAAVLNSARAYATGVASDAYQLVERIPAVHAERAAGRLDPYRARVFADVLGTASDEVVAVVVPAVLPTAAGLSSGVLRKRLIAAAVAADEEFAEQRRVEAERRAAVRTYATADGMAVLATELPAPVTAAMWSRIDRAAQLARASGDDRPIDLLRAEAHAAMVLQPGDPDRPACTAHLEITAPLSALRTPGRHAAADPTATPAAAVARAAAGGCTPTVGRMPITAAHLRELLSQLDALGVQAPAGGSLAVAITGDDGRLLATGTAADLARLASRGCPTHGATARCDCP